MDKETMKGKMHLPLPSPQEMKERLMQMDKEQLADTVMHFYHLFGEPFYDSFKDVKKPTKPEEVTIPVSIFKHVELSALELITLYLKQIKEYKNSHIAQLTARNAQTIWITAKNATNKIKGTLKLDTKGLSFPVAIIKDKRFSVLEAIVGYFVEQKELKLTEVAELLYRDQRTIWTIYDRYKKKKE